ncbi:MAG: TPM domain-containing protein [Planctomycetaceae bacterium]
MYSIRPYLSLLMVAAFLVCSTTARGQDQNRIDLARPGDREFILDEAGMLTEADREKIRVLADKLLTDKAAPIIVVTIESMAQHGGQGLRIETFARLLFDQWEIGPDKLGETAWNYGILLLVSRQDRKARIELGAGWKRDHDDDALRIMDDLIIPEFKQGNFSAGIVAGVEGLDAMARNLELPTRPTPTSHYVIGAIFIGLMIFTVVSLIRRGSSGWAWLMWAGIFGVIGTILYQMAQNRSSGGGGFSGGSFGGGFSGGGGASGSW